ncbi:type II toxin-antitoxin system VapC family toxin [Candidatus Gottesmanbacteria bacterium]|nr:type II toxin-antitoxin system VapC family toxin [Candidatus Gottesmanbacteria bacterium]
MIVIDTSIAVKWIMKDEEDSEKAFILYQNHLLQKETILVPRLFYIEIANSLITKSLSSIATIEKNIRFLYGVKLSVYDPDENDMLVTVRQAKKSKTTVYDMLFAVAAKKYDTILITADEKFVQKTKFPFVKLLSEYKPN